MNIFSRKLLLGSVTKFVTTFFFFCLKRDDSNRHLARRLKAFLRATATKYGIASLPWLPDESQGAHTALTLRHHL
jgi:hypothetical protein